MFLSHSEFNMNSINTDEAIFMEMILAPDVAPEMARNNNNNNNICLKSNIQTSSVDCAPQRMRGPNLLERRGLTALTMETL